MPAHGVLVSINIANSWHSGEGDRHVRLAYIATDSKERLSFVSLQSATRLGEVLGIASRPSHFDDMPYGVVIEVYVAKDLAEGDAVQLALAHAGATTYYPPQRIDDAG
jgi:hypothetical protein